MNDLATRLRRLLDVMQRVHRMSVKAAAARLGSSLGVKAHTVRVYARGVYWMSGLETLRQRELGERIGVIEADYTTELEALAAYEAACARRAA